MIQVQHFLESKDPAQRVMNNLSKEMLYSWLSCHCTAHLVSVLTGSVKVKSRFSMPKYNSFFSCKEWLMYLTISCETKTHKPVLKHDFKDEFET